MPAANDSISIDDLCKAFGGSASSSKSDSKDSARHTHSSSKDTNDVSEAQLLSALGVASVEDSIALAEAREKQERARQREAQRREQQFRARQWRAELDELEARKASQEEASAPAPGARSVVQSVPPRSASVQKMSFSSLFPKAPAAIQPMPTGPSPASSASASEVSAPTHEQAALAESPETREDVSSTPVYGEQADRAASAESVPAPFASEQQLHRDEQAASPEASPSGPLGAYAGRRIMPLTGPLPAFQPLDATPFGSATAPAMQGDAQPGTVPPFAPAQQGVSAQAFPTAETAPVGEAVSEAEGARVKRPFGGAPLPAFSNASFIRPLEPTITAAGGTAQTLPGAAQPFIQGAQSPMGVSGQSAEGAPANTLVPSSQSVFPQAAFTQQGYMPASPALNQAQLSGSSMPGMPQPQMVADQTPTQGQGVSSELSWAQKTAPGTMVEADKGMPNEIVQPRPNYPANAASGVTDTTMPEQASLLPSADAQMQWINQGPASVGEPIKEDETSSKKSTIIGVSLIVMAVICAVFAVLLLTGIIDLSAFSSSSGASSSSSSAVTQAQEGPLTEEAVYSYVVRGTDGGTHEAKETAYFGDDGKLKRSMLEIAVDDPNSAQALLEQLQSEFKDTVRETSIEDGHIIVILDVNRDDLDKDAYTELLATNMAEFKVVD